MYAAHLAAGLAIKAHAPKAPAWALLIGAFVPDLTWIALAVMGVEPAAKGLFFDGWSHSLASIIVEATLFTLIFYRSRIGVRVAIWAAVFSHFVLDVGIHPRPLELFPHSAITLGGDFWSWGAQKAYLGETHYWWIQLLAVLALLTLYLRRRATAQIPPNLAAASCLTVVGLHFFF